MDEKLMIIKGDSLKNHDDIPMASRGETRLYVDE
jgi:hypothetical protein